MMNHAINWFEIPVADFDRANTFYSTIMGTPLNVMSMDTACEADGADQSAQQFKMGMFPGTEEKGTITGTIVSGPGYTPSATGTLVYLNGGDDLNTVLNRVEAAGGSIAMPKTMIDENIGYMAIFNDTEGNRVALHSRG